MASTAFCKTLNIAILRLVLSMLNNGTPLKKL